MKILLLAFKMIYQPQEDSYLLQKHVKELAFGSVLDLGTGSGIQALAAALKKDVKKILAVDKSKEAVENCPQHKKITCQQSDLFQNVKGQFDTIVFNPPYLPKDKREDKVSSLATTGGKHGYELLQKFFNQLNPFLKEDGLTLIVFSSLTKKEKIGQAIKDNLLEFKLLEKKDIAFETLYCYKITKTTLLKKLNQLNIKNIKKYTKGQRSFVYKGQLNNKTVAIKIKKSTAPQNIIQNEAHWLKKLNKKDIGPPLIYSSKEFLITKFIEGLFILDYIQKATKKETIKVLIAISQKCFTLDKMQINKEEMHRPLKHIIIKKHIPVFIDFERTHKTNNPKNVTQFGDFVLSIKEKLKKKGIHINKNKFIKKLKNYKQNQDKDSFQKIVKTFK